LKGVNLTVSHKNLEGTVNWYAASSNTEYVC